MKKILSEKEIKDLSEKTTILKMETIAAPAHGQVKKDSWQPKSIALNQEKLTSSNQVNLLAIETSLNKFTPDVRELFDGALEAFAKEPRVFKSDQEFVDYLHGR